MRANRQTVKEIMEGVNNPTNTKKVGNNTVRYTNDVGNTVIRFHNTDIITELPNGAVKINSGGWKTPTTKDRLNTFLRERKISVHQDNHKWYVMKWDDKTYTYSTIAPFVDGMTIRKDGTVPKKWAQKADSKNRKDDSTSKKIEKYLKIVRKKLAENDTIPSGGDCWFCSMHTVDGGIPLGDATNDHTHIEEHLKEGYVPNSLMWNAMQEAGYRPEVYLHPQWRTRDCAWMNKVVVRNVRKYLRRRMNIPI